MTGEHTPEAKPIKKAPAPRPQYDEALVQRLAERAYRARLGAKDAASMLAKDADGGTKLRDRAKAYAPWVRLILDALNEEAP